MIRGQERPIFVPKGKSIRVVMEGGVILDIANPGDISVLDLKQRVSTQEAEQAELKVKFPDIFGSHINACLTQHGYKVVGGEEASGEINLMETTVALSDWMREAKRLRIPQQEVLSMGADLLHGVTIAERRMGESNAVVKGINTEVVEMSEQIWEIRRQRGKNPSTLGR